MKRHSLRCIVAVLMMALTPSCTSSSSSTPGGWDVTEEKPEGSSGPTPTVSSPGVVPGSELEWAPDDVEVAFHTQDSAQHDYDPPDRYELAIRAYWPPAVEEQERLGIRGGKADFRGFGGPFVRDDILHLYECTLNGGETVAWEHRDHLVHCGGPFITYVFHHGEAPAQRTHTTPSELPEWIRAWYESEGLHIRVADADVGMLEMEVLDEPDYPVFLDLFVIGLDETARRTRLTLKWFDSTTIPINPHHRSFVRPEAGQQPPK